MADRWEVTRQAALMLLDVPDGTRLGVLCNLSPGQTRRDVRTLLESVNLYERFSPELIVVASELATPLPDRRAFAVAAALAEVPIDQCLVVSANLSMLMAAATTATASRGGPSLRATPGAFDADTARR